VPYNGLRDFPAIPSKEALRGSHGGWIAWSLSGEHGGGALSVSPKGVTGQTYYVALARFPASLCR
jgi:hypothetical protein